MKIYLEVYGCTANKGDASLIRGLIKEKNYETVQKIDTADVIILLTCTVIGTTEQRMLSRLRKFKKTGKKIVVAGCMASAQPDLIKSIIPSAKLLSPRYSHHIIDVLNDKKIPFTKKNKTLFSKYFKGAIAPISIAEGCMFSCSYCITSYARGKLMSYPIGEIKKDICYALRQGCKEIQITAQDTASFGLDKNQNLGELISCISQIKGKYRIRVGMMNPYTALTNLDFIIEGYGNPKIYKFLHIPVQSGDNIILNKMNRKYTTNDFIKIVKKFRTKYPDITLSTDVIVGFPTETGEQFQNTINLLKKVNSDITNITRYSARPYTKAKNIKGRIKTEIVKERSKKLTKLCNKISIENNQKHIGKKYITLITERGKNNTLIGRTENYKPVIIREKKVKVGEFVPLVITNATSIHLVGKLI